MQASCAVARSCTSGVQDTHKTCVREVRYPWHPWYGKRIYARCEVRRVGVSVLRCALDELNSSASLEIPEWMFDPGHCLGMKSEALCYASVTALRAVQALLISEAEAGHIEMSVMQAQHPSRDSGGADTDDIPFQSPTVRAISSATTSTEAFAGCLSADAPLVGTDDERTSSEDPCPLTTGGGR